MYQQSPPGGQPGGAQYYSSRSPPPLQHPIPTHPPLHVPDPPVTPTPGTNHSNPSLSSQQQSPADYQRFSSPPIQQQQPQAQAQAQAQAQQPYAAFNLSSSPERQHASYAGYGNVPASSSGPAGVQQRGAYPSGSMTSGAPHHQQTSGQQPGPWGFVGMGPGGFALPPGMVNDATAQMGVQFGRHAMAAGQEYVEKNFSSLLPIPLLKHYFNVSNSYVFHKLRIVLFPWRHRPWSRALKTSPVDAQFGAGVQQAEVARGGGFRPPRDDVNSPDLYIPVMAFVTYILLTSTIHGLESRFHPEVLGLTASKALAVVIVEFCAIKLGCYLLNIQGEGTMVDLVAYSGYKFVGIIVTLIGGLLRFRGTIYWTIFLYTFFANAFFLLRSLRYVVLPDPSSATSVTITHVQRSRRIQFLFSIAVAQIAFMWILCRGLRRNASSDRVAGVGLGTGTGASMGQGGIVFGLGE